jgi:hypothetical protein
MLEDKIKKKLSLNLKNKNWIENDWSILLLIATVKCQSFLIYVN